MNALNAGNIDKKQENILILQAIEGDPHAIETLIKIHQPWVFNIALRMIANFHDAEDATQDIMLKAMLKLSSFKGTSRFRTWLFRITVHHVMDLKESNFEKNHSLYHKIPAKEDMAKDYIQEELPDLKILPPEVSLLIKEIQIKCTLGMLLCLNRSHRIVFILGSILDINAKTGSKILEISEDNYRKILSRSRQRLFHFLNDRCSLVNPDNPCTCERNLPASIKRGYIDPLKLIFNTDKASSIRDILSQTRSNMDDIQYKQGWELYREQPLQESSDFSIKIIEILKGSEVQSILNTAPR